MLRPCVRFTLHLKFPPRRRRRMTRYALSVAVDFSFVVAVMVFLASCEREDIEPIATTSKEAATPPTTEAAAEVLLPMFEDYPAVETFDGTPAEVNLASHPDAKMFRTRLSEISPYDTRFAGHYRIVEFGCGTECQSIWAVDLIDGSVYSLFTASSGVAYRPDSRLIVKNDPAFFTAMLDMATVAEVQSYMESYGEPEFWLEEDAQFERIGSDAVVMDTFSKKIVGVNRPQEVATDPRGTFCGINGKIRSAGFSADGKSFVLADTINGFPLQPEARIFVVDVASNDCVAGGCDTMRGDWDNDVDEDVVLNRLKERTSDLRERLGLVPPQGAIRFAPGELTDDLVAYDLGKQTIEVLLRQDTVGDIGDWKSSLRLEVRASDTVHELDSLKRYRDEVEGYRLGDLYLSPDGTSVAIIVEMRYEILGHAPSTYCRFMVETAVLK